VQMHFTQHKQFSETNVTLDVFQRISGFKFFLNASAGHWNAVAGHMRPTSPYLDHTVLNSTNNGLLPRGVFTNFGELFRYALDSVLHVSLKDDNDIQRHSCWAENKLGGTFAQCFDCSEFAMFLLVNIGKSYPSAPSLNTSE